MSCSLPIAQIQKYCTAELTPQERLSVKQHIVDCPTCLDRYNALVEDYVHGRGPSRPAAEVRPVAARQEIRKATAPARAEKPESLQVRLRLPGWMRQALAPAVLALSFAFVVAVFVAVGTGAYDLGSTAATPEETQAAAAAPAPRPATAAPPVTPAAPVQSAVVPSKLLQAKATPVKALAPVRLVRTTVVRKVESLSFVQPTPVPVPPAAIEAPAPAPMVAAVREPAPKVALIYGLGADPMVVPVVRPMRPEDVVVRTEPRIRPSVRAAVIYGADSEPLVVPVGGYPPEQLVVAGS